MKLEISPITHIPLSPGVALNSSLTRVLSSVTVSLSDIDMGEAIRIDKDWRVILCHRLLKGLESALSKYLGFCRLTIYGAIEIGNW